MVLNPNARTELFEGGDTSEWVLTQDKNLKTRVFLTYTSTQETFSVSASRVNKAMTKLKFSSMVTELSQPEACECDRKCHVSSRDVHSDIFAMRKEYFCSNANEQEATTWLVKRIRTTPPVTESKTPITVTASPPTRTRQSYNYTIGGRHFCGKFFAVALVI